MSRSLKFSIVMTLIWMLLSTVTILNLVYIEYPEVGSDFWFVFIRTFALFTVLPLAIAWGGWWVIKK